VVQLLKAHSRSKGSRGLCSKNIMNRVKQYNYRLRQLSESPA